MNDLHARAATELFAFLKSKTPRSLEWEIKYLRKNDIKPNVAEPFKDSFSLIAWLGTELVYQGYNTQKAKELAQRMRNAWRTHNSRKNGKTVSISISLKPSIAELLAQMSKGENKSDIISKLISNNYQSYLAEKRELAKQKAEQKEERLKKQIAIQESKKTMMSPCTCSLQFPCDVLTEQLNQKKELADGISKLHSLVSKQNEQQTSLF